MADQIKTTTRRWRDTFRSSVFWQSFWKDIAFRRDDQTIRLVSELQSALGALDHIAASYDETKEYLTGYADGTSKMIRTSLMCGGVKL